MAQLQKSLVLKLFWILLPAVIALTCIHFSIGFGGFRRIVAGASIIVSPTKEHFKISSDQSVKGSIELKNGSCWDEEIFGLEISCSCIEIQAEMPLVLKAFEKRVVPFRI